MGSIVIKSIDKVDEFTDPELLPPTTAVRLENLVLDSQLNKPIKRGGFSVFNTNSAYGGIYSIEDLVDSAGNNQMLVLSGIDGRSILKSAAGTGAWSTLKTMTTAFAKLRLATYSGRFYITNGVDAPFATDLTTNTDLLLTAPDVSNVTTEHSTGGDLTPNAKYYWALAYITKDGEISPSSAWITHNYSKTSGNSTYTGYGTIDLKILPVSSDPRVVGRLLYRTRADELFPFLLTRLDNVSTTYSDHSADTLLDLSQAIKYGQAINTCKYLITHKERLFMGYLTLTDIAPKMIRNGLGSNGAVFAGAEFVYPTSMAAGNYYYRVIFVDKYGNVSAHAQTAAITIAAGKSIELTNIPQPIGEGIESRLYRSKSYGGNTQLTDFFFVGNNYSNKYLDTMTDAQLGAGTQPAPTTSTTGYSSGVLYSEIGKPSQVPSENLILVYPDDVDFITGLVDDEDGVLVVKQNSICKIFTRGEPLSWEVRKLVSQIGCDQPLSIQKIGSRVYFLNNKQLYRYPDSVDFPVNKDLNATLKTVTAINDSAYSNYHQWYVLIVTITNTKYILIYSEKLDTWYKFSSTLTWECVTEKLNGADRGKLIFGTSSIYTLWKYDESISLDNGAEIIPWLKFKTFISPEPNTLIRLRKLWANYKKKTYLPVNHTFFSAESKSIVGLSAVSTNILTDTFSKSNTFANGDRVMLDDIAITTGINNSTVYYVINATPTSFSLSLTQGGAAVDLTGGDGWCTVYPLITATDNVDSPQQGNNKLFRKITDAMTPEKALTALNKLIYQIDGAGLAEFNGAKIEYREVNRGQR